MSASAVGQGKSRMKLHWSPRSPYVRKVMIAAHELGLVDQLDCVRSLAAMGTPNADIMRDNPLSKIPTLVLGDGRVLMDSSVIVEYLNSLAGGTLIPPDGPARWETMARQALASGLLDALILWRNELNKPEERRTPEWLAAFAAKTGATLDRFEREVAAIGAKPFDAGHIALGCALSYLDFRFGTLDWRTPRPALAGWHRGFAARPSAVATEAIDA